MSDPIEALAHRVVSARWDDLDPAAIAALKVFVLDTLGVCVSGSAAPLADRVRATAARWGSGEEATVIGLGTRLPAPHAALVNAVQTHNQEYDCIHEPAVVHPMATVFSALLAAAERRGKVPGRDFLLALALGIDVATTIGAAARRRLSFFRPATAGVFGVAAAVGKLEGLGFGALLDALGLAYGQAAGTMQAHIEGKPSLALQMGYAARGGINAVDLAAAGFPGPHQVLEGPYGYFRLMEGAWDSAAALRDLESRWRVTQLSHKPFPTGRATHGGIDAIQRLLARESVAPEAIERATLLAPPLICQLVGRPYQAGMEVSYARLCFPYVGAVALMRGSVEVDDFAPARLADPMLAALAARIAVVDDGNADETTMTPQRLRLFLKSGRICEAVVEHILGSPSNPLGRERHLAKFRRCWAGGARPLDAERGERIIELVDRLDLAEDATALARA